VPRILRRVPPLRRAGASLVCGLACGALLVAIGGGCSSEDPNPLGADLVETVIDTTLRALTQDQVLDYGVLDITEQGAPLDETEVLYLGSNGTDASSILANYDFSFLDHPDSAYLRPYLTAANITSVKIQIDMLVWYSPFHGVDVDTDYVAEVKDWYGAQKYYDVHQLVAPFDTLTYPAPEPPFYSPLLNDVELEGNSGTIFLDCAEEPFAEWIAQRAKVGLIIREGSGSQPGLLGFASKEMVHAGSTLARLAAGTRVGPVLIFALATQPEAWPDTVTTLVVPPVADVSTWHELEARVTDPDEAVMVRTHLRSYPVVRFDLSQLPPNVRINRANLVVVNDTTRSLGHKSVLTCSELPQSFAPPGRTTVDLDDLGAEVYFLYGNGTWEPTHLTDHELEFNVTASIQRFVNTAYTGERGFLLAAGEYFFPGYNSDPDPDFWFTKWVFFGAAADSARRPRLEISYTRLDELSGGGGEP